MANFSHSLTTLRDATIRATGFLSRLPVPARYFETGDAPGSGSDMRRDVAAFPIAGMMIALVPAAVILVCALLRAPDVLTAAFAVLSLVAATGALHEDGLADVADGFGGGHDRVRRLEIMKDSRIGTYGAIALAGSLLLRVAGLAAILQAHGAPAAVLAVIAVAALSRSAIVWFWAGLPSARPDGVAGKAGTPDEDAVSTAAMIGLMVFAVLGLVAVGFLRTAIALLLALAMLQLFSMLCRRMIGGQTGDTLGACQQIVEIMLLTGLALGVSIPT